MKIFENKTILNEELHVKAALMIKNKYQLLFLYVLSIFVIITGVILIVMENEFGLFFYSFRDFSHVVQCLEN
ncbi:MAG: hypothetical protein PHC62_02860 [Candidatus Izemoplasmatales bacterium]|nr:hypothetical protein [Candidatus Izemoplasmatales bacterium]